MAVFVKYDVLSTSLGDGGEVRVKLGDAAKDAGVYDNAAWWGAAGYYQRPKDADDDGAAQALCSIQGSNARCIATRDNRLTSKYGQLAAGDSGMFGYGDAAVVIKDASDSLSLITKNHADGDQTMIVQVNGDRGEITLLVGGNSGPAMIKMKSGLIVLAVDNGGSITLDSQGVHITGNTFDCATGGGNLGVVGGVPPPPGAKSILCGPTGNGASPSSKWTCA